LLNNCSTIVQPPFNLSPIGIVPGNVCVKKGLETLFDP
jgi:hypothetical protein